MIKEFFLHISLKEKINMSVDKKQIDYLYELYGFKKDYQYDYCTVYLYDQGYFINSEIVVFDNNKATDLENIKIQYTRSGYSVSVKYANDFYEIKEQLFKGFFKIGLSNQQVVKEYHDFCSLQAKKLGGLEYQYIEPRYTIDGSEQTIPICDKIHSLMKSSEAQLIILEAPAGFGKTCTSYEVSKLLAEDNEQSVPILAELSKNRLARIFDYVLYEEINRKFTQLSYELVTAQIIEGRIPLIIDGFDEILSKSSTEDNNKADDAKSMLDTIANLLKEGSKAKILLTSRKSSIFTGEIYEKWVANKLCSCTVNRIQILAPTITVWLAKEQRDALDSIGISLDLISNPVLLTILRSISSNTYIKKFRSSEDIVELYLHSLFEREKERQQLNMTIDEQRNLLVRLAASMVVLDISSDEPEGIKALIEVIIGDKITDYLNSYRDYSNENNYAEPEEDEFIMKLVHHALLDRVKPRSNYIGFINEFIFGFFIGEAVSSGELRLPDVADKYFEMSINAFSVENAKNRKCYYDKIIDSKRTLDANQQLLIENCLTREMSFDYIDEYISDQLFSNNVVYQTEHYFFNCVFYSCIFSNISIDNNLFEGCHFINCSFYNLDISYKMDVEEKSTFISCVGYEKLLESMHTTKDTDENKLDDRYYEKLVLEQFWKTGQERAELRRYPVTLFRGIKQKDRIYVGDAIERLIAKGIMSRYLSGYELNTSHMGEIKEILNR